MVCQHMATFPDRTRVCCLILPRPRQAHLRSPTTACKPDLQDALSQLPPQDANTYHRVKESNASNYRSSPTLPMTSRPPVNVRSPHLGSQIRHNRLLSRDLSLSGLQPRQESRSLLRSSDRPVSRALPYLRRSTVALESLAFGDHRHRS